MSLIVPSRRRFLFGAAALIAAPAIAKAANLMPISVLKPPKLWGDGIHDDTEALQTYIEREIASGSRNIQIPQGVFRLSATLHIGMNSFTTLSGYGSVLMAQDVPRDQPVLNVGGRNSVPATNCQIRGFHIEDFGMAVDWRA